MASSTPPFIQISGGDLADAAVIVSAILALVLILSNRANTKRTNTLHFILQTEADKDIIRARERFIDIIRSGRKSNTYLAGPDAGSSQKDAYPAKRGWGPGRKDREGKLSEEDEERRDDRLAIDKILNVHELTAVAIQEGALDERVFRRWYNKAYIRDYESMTGYIEAIRINRQNPAIFKELEALAKAWKEDRNFYAEPGWARRKWRALKKAIKA
ncbi:DUF4760 domain-containing protein [Parvularcula oceani]|uniref:DUF4760 domain-containing protein n=1 Tax=Parvularcula oceani TaxID=1247963 RepID=UPI0006898C3E|nr:DUF4760 domain-containing protein [Parvularcula oceani]